MSVHMHVQVARWNFSFELGGGILPTPIMTMEHARGVNESGQSVNSHRA
jgi:hypothetical protein